MTEPTLIPRWWTSILSMDIGILEDNASSLCHLHNSEQILGLQPLPSLQFPEIRSSVLTRKPAFKNLELVDIRFLRNSLLTEDTTPELTAWLETLLRYLEINRQSLIKKARSKFGSKYLGQMATLELTALMMDAYFCWSDLRYLNVVLKLMDMHAIIASKTILREITGQIEKLPLVLLLVRLMILRQVALQVLGKN